MLYISNYIDIYLCNYALSEFMLNITFYHLLYECRKKIIFIRKKNLHDVRLNILDTIENIKFHRSNRYKNNWILN